MGIPGVGDEFGRYRLDRVIGQGGMGVVFAATDLRLDRTVALKVITGPLADNEDFRRRFHDEAAVLSRLDSPYVITIHDHDEVDGQPFIVTQFVDGTDLGTFLHEHGPLPAKVALTMCAQVARGLGDAHRRGVIHRDVKPGNILLREPGTPEMHAYVCDFGIARSDSSEGHTATGLVAGTWAYLAPERTQGASASPASDLYALGCVLWACLTGSEPYTGTDVEMAIAHAQAPVPQLPASSTFITELNGVLARLLAKDPAERYADAAAARADLERLAAAAPGDTLPPAPVVPATAIRGSSPSGPGAPVPPPPPPPAGPYGAAPAIGKPPTKKWPLAVAAVVVLALVGGGAAWAVTRGEDDPAAKEKNEKEIPQVVHGDIDGNGYGDAVIRQSRFDSLSPLPLWTLPSSGKSLGAPERREGGSNTPALGDVDGDGRSDVVWADEDDDRVTVRVEPGDGEPWDVEFADEFEFGFGGFTAEVGDLTGDGKDDLIVPVGPENGRVIIMVAESTGDGFADPTEWYAIDHGGKDPSWTLSWTGDFDGDGTDDLLYWAETDLGNAGETRVLISDGEQLLDTTPRPLNTNALSPFLATWLVGDIDDDGADEIVVPSATCRLTFAFGIVDGTFDKPERWYKNPLTREEARACLHEDPTRSWGLSDVDGDGAADLVELREPDEDDKLGIRAYLAGDGEFGAPEGWGSLPCLEECEDTFFLVS